MRSNKILLFCLLLAAGLKAQGQAESFSSQSPRRGDYALVAYISGGVGYYLSVAGVPDYLHPTIRKWNPVSSARIMWHPDHLMRVGVETGYMTFLSYKLQDSAGAKGSVSLNAVPLLVEWSMALTPRFNVFAGSGVYFLTTHLKYSGKAMAHKISLGWMAAASYIQPLSARLGLGVEVKWLDAAESTDGSIGAQLQVVWKFLKW